MLVLNSIDFAYSIVAKMDKLTFFHLIVGLRSSGPISVHFFTGVKYLPNSLKIWRGRLLIQLEGSDTPLTQ